MLLKKSSLFRLYIVETKIRSDFFMIIAIDHGNKQVKTMNKTFTAGYAESEFDPRLGGETILYEGKYYTLTEKRINYMRNKALDERYLVLTMFALAYEIEANNAYSSDFIEVDLLVGLPPSHIGGQIDTFKAYFLRNNGLYTFSMNGKSYGVRVRSVNAYPQGMAAIMTLFDQIEAHPKVTLIDIGGYTVIYMVFRNGEPDKSAYDSLENGVIHLYNAIIKRVLDDFDTRLNEAEIDAVINGTYDDVSDEIKAAIESEAKTFVHNLLNRLREDQIELKTGITVFAGGGSILLKKYLEQWGDRITKPIFITDINAMSEDMNYFIFRINPSEE